MNDLRMSYANASFSKEPLVSVVITTHNRPTLVLNSIRSVKSQTYKHFEIIVVDDCSLVAISEAVSAHYSDVTVVRNTTNKGAGYSRNAGIAHARGEIIAFLDDDDEWLPNKLEEQVAQLHTADACLCGYKTLETGKIRTHNMTDVTAHHLRQGNLFCGASGFVARRYVFERIRFDDSLLTGQDWDIYVQIIRSFSIRNIGKPLFVYRRGEESLSNRREDDPKLFASRLAKLEKNRAFLGEFYFGVRVAGTYLRFIGTRRNRIKRILFTMRKAGFFPTGYYLYKKLIHRDGVRFSN